VYDQYNEQIDWKEILNTKDAILLAELATVIYFVLTTALQTWLLIHFVLNVARTNSLWKWFTSCLALSSTCLELFASVDVSLNLLSLQPASPLHLQICPFKGLLWSLCASKQQQQQQNKTEVLVSHNCYKVSHHIIWSLQRMTEWRSLKVTQKTLNKDINIKSFFGNSLEWFLSFTVPVARILNFCLHFHILVLGCLTVIVH